MAFIQSDSVTISNLGLFDGSATGSAGLPGGDANGGGGGGGGGLGAGGGVFIDKGSVTLSGIQFTDCRAIGGNGGVGSAGPSGVTGGRGGPAPNGTLGGAGGPRSTDGVSAGFGSGGGGGNMTNAAATIALASAATLTLDFTGGFLPQQGATFFLLNRSDAGLYGASFAGASEGSVLEFEGVIGQITYQANWTGSVGTSSFTGGNDVAFRVIPEPSAALLIAAGWFAGQRRRRVARR